MPVSQRLFARARSPAQMVELEIEEILTLIQGTTFAENKAPQIRQISEQILAEFGGDLPADPKVKWRHLSDIAQASRKVRIENLLGSIRTIRW